ncbi:MAG TPA: type IV secretory system conjugative DNA transfer family protein, partial [Solirubrobacteraceae bacterium]
MSRTIHNESWGPRHQQPQPAPAKYGIFWKIIGWFVVAVFAHGVIDPHGHNVFGWSAEMVILGWLATMFVRGVRNGSIPVQWVVPLGEHVLDRLVDRGGRAESDRAKALPIEPRSLAEDVRLKVARLGGGAYLGVEEDGNWVTADPESAVMVLGPPRSGKTSAVIIPALLGASGPVLSTSTKPDVMNATLHARAELGEVWLFDPAGENTQLPDGVRRLCWSPVAAAGTWDQALVMARAMTACTRTGAGSTNEQHWTERAAALLAPLLYTAHL